MTDAVLSLYRLLLKSFADFQISLFLLISQYHLSLLLGARRDSNLHFTQCCVCCCPSATPACECVHFFLLVVHLGAVIIMKLCSELILMSSAARKTSVTRRLMYVCVAVSSCVRGRILPVNGVSV